MDAQQKFHSMNARDALRALESSANGLSESEASARLQQFGANELRKEERAGALSMFLTQFKDFLIIILIIAAVISGFVGEQLDAAAIIAIVLLNAAIGFAQEYKAERALEALKKMVAPKARVIRGGAEKLIDARELVLGDLIVLNEGDRIPADARLIEEVSLEADEAPLTGESLPVKKDAGAIVGGKEAASEWVNSVFLGTTITRGRGRAVVAATGMQTQFGRIAELVSEAGDEETPLQKKLAVLGKQLGIAALAICAVIFLVGVLATGLPLMEMFLVAVALAVAAIPEGLPAVVTITLAVGVQRMARKNAIIRRLPAVETLGAATVICTDKTGTLTKNELTVRRVFVDDAFIQVTGEGYSLHGEFLRDGKKIDAAKQKSLAELLYAGALCNNSNISMDAAGKKADVLGDPTEACLLVLARKAGLDYQELREARAFVAENPFDSKRKMMTVVRAVGKEKKAFIKGAPEILLEKSSRVLLNGVEKPLTARDKKKILDANKEMASGALRVLGFAYKKIPAGGEKLGDLNCIEKDLVFIGLAGMMDPPRPEARDAVRACHEAGIRVIMITGDNPDTAGAIARELGFLGGGAHVVSGVELNELSDAQLKKIAGEIGVYARVSPEHKLRIVNALKANGEVVAMTGDGVNDAPAIKRADIGVSMGLTGTDVTKEASDMVVSDDNFASIVRAVEEGRVIYDNILKAVRYLVSCNIGELLAIFLAIIGGLKSPLTPLQILWMNIVTDGPPALALALDPRDPDVMKRKPRDPSEKILSRSSLTQMVLVGLLVCAGTLGVFVWYLNAGAIEAAKAGTMAFSVIILFQKFFAFAVSGSKNKILLETGVFRNKWLWLALAFGVGSQILITEWAPAQAVFQTVSLNAFDWLVVILVSSTALVLPEVAKLVKRWRGKSVERAGAAVPA